MVMKCILICNCGSKEEGREEEDDQEVYSYAHNYLKLSSNFTITSEYHGDLMFHPERN